MKLIPEGNLISWRLTGEVTQGVLARLETADRRRKHGIVALKPFHRMGRIKGIEGMGCRMMVRWCEITAQPAGCDLIGGSPWESAQAVAVCFKPSASRDGLPGCGGDDDGRPPSFRRCLAR